MDNTEAAKVSAALVNEFIDKSHKLWENHPINVKRAKEGKLKANVVLTRDAGHLLAKILQHQRTLQRKFRLFSGYAC